VLGRHSVEERVLLARHRIFLRLDELLDEHRLHARRIADDVRVRLRRIDDARSSALLSA
jgi:hypothetical protein